MRLSFRRRRTLADGSGRGIFAGSRGIFAGSCCGLTVPPVRLNPNSSNSQRLREVAEREGCPIAILAQRASDLDWSQFDGITSLGITAGASAPEVIVEEIMGAFAERYELHVETVSAAEENEFFPLPRSLRPDAAE